MRRQRQLGAKHVQFLQIEAQRAADCSRSVPRMTSAVTNGLPSRSPPIQLPMRRNDASSPAAPPSLRVQPVLQRALQPRHLVQEGVVVERKAVGDLVEHGELGPAQQIGLPQRQHRAAQLLVACLGLLRRQLHAFAPVEQRRDLHLAVHRALAPHFGRMRGQHRADQGVGEESAQLGGLMPALSRVGQRLGERARRGDEPAPRAAHLADVVLVLGDVGEVREIAEGADDPDRVGWSTCRRGWSRVRAAPACPRRGGIGSRSGGCSRPGRTPRRPPGRARYRRECARAGGYRPQPGVFLQRQRSSLRLDRTSVSEGMVSEGTIWEDMAGYLRNCPAIPSVQVFCRSAR